MKITDKDGREWFLAPRGFMVEATPQTFTPSEETVREVALLLKRGCGNSERDADTREYAACMNESCECLNNAAAILEAIAGSKP